MFNGIIQGTGKVLSLRKNGSRAILILNVGGLLKKLTAGDSVAVNGICLTVTRKSENRVFFDLSAETLQRTNLSSCESSSEVNLELPLTAQSMMSGHFVQGHVEGIGRVQKWIRKGQDVRLFVKLPSALMPFCVPKGSIAMNGVSLTIASQQGRTVGVALIPYTLEHTNLDALKAGDPVNIETDVIGRYVVASLKKSYDKPISRRAGSTRRRKR